MVAFFSSSTLNPERPYHCLAVPSELTLGPGTAAVSLEGQLCCVSPHSCIWPGGSCLSLFSATVIKHWQKPPGGGKGFIWLTVRSVVHHQGKPRQERKQTPQRKAANWLASHNPLSYLSYAPQDHLPSAGTAHRHGHRPI